MADNKQKAVETMDSIVEKTPIQAEFEAFLENTPYFLSGDGSLMRSIAQKIGKDWVEVPKRLANFVAKVDRQLIRDDGMTQSITFVVSGVLDGGTLLKPSHVSAPEFASMNWIPKSWGLSPNIEPGQGARDFVRHAIQCTVKKGTATEVVFTHLGFRQMPDGSWVFLHAGRGNVDVEEYGLSRYEMSEPDARMMRTAVELLDVAPRSVMVPLIALAFLAPLCELLRRAGIEPAFTVWLVGITGTMKSTLAALILSFFGQFDGKSLPGNFRDTPNSLEKRAFAAKDVLFVVDDYHPVSTEVESRNMVNSAQKLLRAYGDRQGRARMTSDLAIRAGYIPRGMLLVTGEDVPDVGQSGAARYIAIELEKNAIDKSKLTDLQQRAGELSAAMASYCEWISPQINSLSQTLGKTFRDLRDAAQNKGEHARLAETGAWLHTGFSAFLRFAVNAGAMTQEVAEREELNAWLTILGLSSTQSRRVSEDRPSKRFIEVLRDMLASEIVWCKPVTGIGASKDGALIGWENFEAFFFIPGEVYRQVCRFCSTQGTRFPLTERRLWTHLAADGMIDTEKVGNRSYNTILKTIDGSRRRVLVMPKSRLEE